ncbi:MAG: DUF58 domain-containing protein [Synergistaceae bacterium]|jgi:uncharacterized protein (DUF58 family)|nr:DUF58 domain-containing protein [Synergistaceae bacterium]
MKVISIHRSGMIYIAVSIIMGILAINGGNNFHYLAASVILGYMLASGVAGRRNIRNAEVSLSFPDEIYAMTPFMLTVELRNKSSRVPILLLNVKAGDSSVLFHMVQPGEVQRRSVMYSFTSRGEGVISDIELSSVYPFDLFTRYWPTPFKGRAAVFPKPVEGMTNCEVFDMENPEDETAYRQRLCADLDIVGVRPYVEGDPMKLIHWKSTARTGRLNTRVYDEQGSGRERMIDLDALISRGLESGLSAASYIIRLAILSGDPIGMKDGETIYPPSSMRYDKLAMLTRLAFYD